MPLYRLLLKAPQSTGKRKKVNHTPRRAELLVVDSRPQEGLMDSNPCIALSPLFFQQFLSCAASMG